MATSGGRARDRGLRGRRLAAATVVAAAGALAGGGVGLFWGRGPAPLATLEMLAFLAFALLGALLLVRRPGHPIGPVFVVIGLGLIVEQFAAAYAVTAAGAAAGLPGAATAGWVADWLFAPTITAFAVGLLVFPTGRPPSPTWGRVLALVLLVGAVATLGWAVASWPARTDPARVAPLPDGVAGLALRSLTIALVAGLAAAAASLPLRWRRAQGEQRRQLKWLALAAVALVAVAALGLLLELLDARPPLLIEALGAAALAGTPTAVAIAILRHHLYDIDRLLSRTVAYTLLTGVLATVYVGSTVLLRQALAPVAGESQIAVAASTLLVAGLFTPVRRRLQTAVDRRFHRARYDAERTIEAFRSRLRDDVRVEALTADLRATVTRVVQPTSASVWLAAPPGRDDPRARPG